MANPHWRLADATLESIEDDFASNSSKELALANRQSSCSPQVIRERCRTRRQRRANARWRLDDGILSWTVALDPIRHQLSQPHMSRLSLIASMAIIDSLRGRVLSKIPLGIRWPNKVESMGRKLGRVSPERVETQEGPRLLINFGVNIRSARLVSSAPTASPLLSTTVRSGVNVEELRGSSVQDREFDQIIQDASTRFQQLLVPMVQEDIRLAERWDHLNALRGQRARVFNRNRVLEGVVLGIDPVGALHLACADGIQRIAGGRLLS